jgi:hypothetical protein
MLDEPWVLEVAVPLAATEATPVFDDCQVALEVTSCLVPSVKIAVALKFCVAPFGIAAVVGNTCNDWTAALPTVPLAEADCEPLVAVTAKLPFAIACTIPDAFTDTMLVGLAAQLTEFVMSADVPSV